MLRRRSERELYYLILSDCIQEKTPAEVQAHTMIYITHVRALVSELKKYKLLTVKMKATKRREGKYIHFKTTKKGARYVKLYAQLLEPLKGFKSYA